MVQHKKVNIIHHINILITEGESYMIISVDAGKAFDKVQHCLIIRAFKNKGKLLNMITCICKNPTANIGNSTR